MSKVPKCNVQAHPFQYVVATWEHPNHWTLRAQFINEQDALNFAKSLKSFKTLVVKPSLVNYKKAPVGERVYKDVYKEGWDA